MNLKSIIFFILVGIAIVEILGCKESRKDEDLHNGKPGQNDHGLQKGQALYREKCTSCHNYQAQNNQYYPALYQMVKMDRSVLMQKLTVLENDSLHKAVISWKDNSEIRAVKHFVSTWNGISP